MLTLPGLLWAIVGDAQGFKIFWVYSEALLEENCTCTKREKPDLQQCETETKKLVMEKWEGGISKPILEVARFLFLRGSGGWENYE